jgi:GTP pyrophosphokinase
MKSTNGGMHAEFVVEVKNLSHLNRVVRAVNRVKGVLEVERRETFEKADLEQ